MERPKRTTAQRKGSASDASEAERVQPLMPRRPSLARVLRYRNDDVLHRFLKLYDVSWAEAEDLFTEVKKWLWLCSQPEAKALSVTSPMHMMDEMWHNFVLFTRDYALFCDRYFGRLLHHAPTRQSEIERRRRDPRASERAFEDRLRAAMGFTFDHLGEETLWKWHVYFPARYGPTFFAAHRKVPRFSVPDLRDIAGERALVSEEWARRASETRAALASAGYHRLDISMSADQFRSLSLLLGDIRREEDADGTTAGTDAAHDNCRFVAYLGLGRGPVGARLSLRPAKASRRARTRQLTLAPGEVLYVNRTRIWEVVAQRPATTCRLKRLWIAERRPIAMLRANRGT